MDISNDEFKPIEINKQIAVKTTGTIKKKLVRPAKLKLNKSESDCESKASETDTSSRSVLSPIGSKKLSPCVVTREGTQVNTYFDQRSFDNRITNIQNKRINLLQPKEIEYVQLPPQIIEKYIPTSEVIMADEAERKRLIEKLKEGEIKFKKECEEKIKAQSETQFLQQQLHQMMIQQKQLMEQVSNQQSINQQMLQQQQVMAQQMGEMQNQLQQQRHVDEGIAAAPFSTPQAEGKSSPIQMTHSTNHVSADKALVMVSELNGVEGDGLLQWIETVNLAVQYCKPSQQLMLLALIKNNKITGYARESIDIQSISSFEDLASSVKNNLIATVSSRTLESELNQIKQKMSKTVSDYSIRFGKISKKLIFVKQQELERNHNPYGTNAIIDDLKSKCKDTFISGLNDIIRRQVTPLQPLNIADAIVKAKDVEIQENQSRGWQPKFNQQRPQQRFISRPMNPINQRSPQQVSKITCNYCKLSGHSENNCFKKRNFQKTGQPGRPPQLHCTTEEEMDLFQEEKQAQEREYRQSEQGIAARTNIKRKKRRKHQVPNRHRSKHKHN